MSNKARRSVADSPHIGGTSPAHRSRVTNGSALLTTADGRSAWARRMRDLMALHLSDLGGEGAVSAAEKSIIRRAATLTVELERMEERFATDGEADADALDLYSRTSGNLRRLLEAIGLRRRPRDVTPDLSSYIEGRAA
jgi:hypothetical protein